MDASTHARTHTKSCRYLYERAVCVEGVEVVVEDGLPNDIQRQLTETSLHVYGLPRLCNYLHTRHAYDHQPGLQPAWGSAGGKEGGGERQGGGGGGGGGATTDCAHKIGPPHQ